MCWQPMFIVCHSNNLKMTTHPQRRRTDIPIVQRITAVLWPSFLTSGLATVLLFTFFNPEEIAVCTGQAGNVSNVGAYTIGFFMFWLLTSFTCSLTCYFQKPCDRPDIKNQPQ